MDLADAWKDRRVIVMTALGVLSGVLCTYSYELSVLWQEASVGLIFGVIIGAYLFHIGRATPFRAAAFAVLSLASWMVAERFAIKVFGDFSSTNELGSWQGLATGVSAGLLGALLLVLSILVLFPFFRRPGLCLATILVGGATGALLAFADVVETLFALFPPWQGAFALCFALGLPRGGPSE